MKSTGIKLAYLSLALLIWKLYFMHSCIVFFLVASSTVFFIATAFAESTLLHRKNIATVVFKPDSWLFRWLWRKWMVLIRSVMMAIISALLLLMVMLQWTPLLWGVMAVDALLILFMYHRLNRYFEQHALAQMHPFAARKSAITLNIVLMMPVSVALMLYSPSPDYLDASLAKTLHNVSSIMPAMDCKLVSLLYSWDMHKEAFGWWAMFKVSENIGQWKFVGWSLFFTLQLMYLWIYSVLIVSTTVSFNSLIDDTSRPHG